MDSGLIVQIALSAAVGIYGFLFHSDNKLNVKERCIDNYSECIMNEKANCDKILEVCKGYIKFEEDEASDLPSVQDQE